MNAVVYARFSSHRQGEQSIEGQVAEAERFAKAHHRTQIRTLNIVKNVFALSVTIPPEA